MRQFKLELDLTVGDEQALAQATLEYLIENDIDEDDARRSIFGLNVDAGETDIDIGYCLLMLLDRSELLPVGSEICNSAVQEIL